MELTPHQLEKMTEALDAIGSGLNRVVITGPAGVGKTFLVNQLLKIFHRNGIVYVTAPTHKALAVLRGKIDHEEYIEFATIHSALKLRRKISSTGVISFAPDNNPRYPPFAGCRLLIIDEASMLNQEMLNFLKAYDFPIIFLGDEKQINPVKEPDSPVFHQHWYTVELTQIVRQGEGNPIIDLSRNLPLIWKGKADLTENKHGYLYSADRQKVISKLAEANGTDELKYLAWTNAEVDAINNSVRTMIYGENPAMIEEGETLILGSSYQPYYTNQEIKIKTLEIVEKEVSPPGMHKVDLKLYIINNEIKAVHEDSLIDFKKICRELKSLAINDKISWVQYYNFLEGYADFTYNHAITVHKSQGSTYKNVILNVSNIKRNPDQKERRRLFYTAVTRASELLILYNVK